ncbi:hypothetical protein SHIRM173S_08020 [Streptomyces hirsutus]
MRESRRPHLSNPNAVLRVFFIITRAGGPEISPMGEEAEVAESEVPGLNRSLV